MIDYQQGWKDCRDLCAAIAELRLQAQSVLVNVLPAVDDLTGEDTATQHEWFCKGRESVAANIARDIKALIPPFPVQSCVLVKALDQACNRLQSFLDTFGDLGDCVTQADLNDWQAIATRVGTVQATEGQS